MYIVGAVVSREIGSYRRRARCLSFVLPSSALRCAGTTQDKSERDGRNFFILFSGNRQIPGLATGGTKAESQFLFQAVIEGTVKI